MTKYLLPLLSLFLLLHSCNEGIDPIKKVEPGPDEMPPSVTIKYPQQGTQIRVLEEVTSIDIQFQVEDDIEIGEIELLLDGNQIATFSDFKDYRRAIEEYKYDNLTNGEHQLTVKATDKSGKTTEKTVTFEKISPYTPLYEGEMLYMPFNGDYVDLINLQAATVVGNPGFAGESVIMGDGQNAYKGAADSYLTMPTENITKDEFSVVFWYKIVDDLTEAGILTMSPPDPNNPSTPNNRKSGFRFFRELRGGNQLFKLNLGNGESDNWFTGGGLDIPQEEAQNKWMHIAFTVSASEVKVYIDGVLAKEGEFPGIDWTGCDILSIMSGAPRFTQWGHLSDQSIMDELRMFDRVLSPSEIKSIIARESGESVSGYEPEYEGEVFYMPFENEYTELVSGASATVVGMPGFDVGVKGRAYSGAEGSYLTFPTENIANAEFSVVFWHKIVDDLTEAGILTAGPPDPENPEMPNNRTAGFRFFRELRGGNQLFKLNLGNGDSDNWFDGGGLTIPQEEAQNQWMHIAFTVSTSEVKIYVNGELAKEGDFPGIDWTGCDILSIMSGAPRFTGWNHLSDQSIMDELYIFDKALSQEEVQKIMNDN